MLSASFHWIFGCIAPIARPKQMEISTPSDSIYGFEVIVNEDESNDNLPILRPKYLLNTTQELRTIRQIKATRYTNEYGLRKTLALVNVAQRIQVSFHILEQHFAWM